MAKTPVGYAFDAGVPSAPSAGEVFTSNNPWVADVTGAFGRIETEGSMLAVHDGGLFPGHRYTGVNVGKKDRALNHFQGVQRLRKARYAVISGGDALQPASHLFVVRMHSCGSKADWGTNLESGKPPARDKVLSTIALGGKYWHGGGIAALGDVVAVPLENKKGNGSRIVFLQLARPKKPKRFGTTIERQGRPKAGAVALTRLPNGYYLCAVWYEVKGETPKGRIDFYLSKDKDISSGFLAESKLWTYGELKSDAEEKRDPAYQAIGFVCQGNDETRDPGTFSLFLVGSEAVTIGGASPTLPSRHFIDLHEVKLAEATLREEWPALEALEIHKRKTIEVSFDDGAGHLAAAGGVYVNARGGLNYYSAAHWRRDKLIYMTEFVGT